MPNNIIIPRDKFDQYMAREEFYKENLTSFPMIFPIKDLANDITLIDKYREVPHFKLNTNLLNSKINERLKDKFINKFVFEVNPKNSCELQLLSTDDNSSLKKIITTFIFTSNACVIGWKLENVTTNEIRYVEKDIKGYYKIDDFWDRFINTIVNTL